MNLENPAGIELTWVPNLQLHVACEKFVHDRKLANIYRTIPSIQVTHLIEVCKPCVTRILLHTNLSFR
jgi:hypothetical protein